MKNKENFTRKKTADPANQVFSPVTALETINKEETKEKAVGKLVFVSVKKGEIEHFGKKEILTEAKALKSVFGIFLELIRSPVIRNRTCSKGLSYTTSKEGHCTGNRTNHLQACNERCWFCQVQ